MAEAVAILRRHGIDAAATLLPRQGIGAYAWAAGGVVLKIARPGCSAEIVREAVAAPIARAAGVRTPALIAWADGGGEAYSIWERVDGGPIAESGDASAWREVGRQLARLHTIEHCDDPRRVLRTDNKRDARPHLHALAPERAAALSRWLDRLEAAPTAAARLLHYDVHEHNVLCSRQGATLIDWGDAAWGDPASDFGSIPMAAVPDVLAGYEEQGSLGDGTEPRILRALLGQSVRMLAQKKWAEPLDELLRFAGGGRWQPWLLSE